MTYQGLKVQHGLLAGAKGKDQPLGPAGRSPEKCCALVKTFVWNGTILWENVGFDEFQLLKNIGQKCFENCLTFSKWQSFNVSRSKCCFILIASINWRLKKMLKVKWNSWTWVDTKCSLAFFLPQCSYFCGNFGGCFFLFSLFHVSELGYLKPHKLLWEGIPSSLLSTFSNAVALLVPKWFLFYLLMELQAFFRHPEGEGVWLCRGTEVQSVRAALVCPALSVGFLASLVSPHPKGKCVSSVSGFVLRLSDKHPVFAELNTLGKREMITLNAPCLKGASCVYKSGARAHV